MYCVQTKDELMRLRREVVRSPKSTKSSLAAQAMLRRVENERDDALTRVQSLTVERDTLHEQLKVFPLLNSCNFAIVQTLHSCVQLCKDLL